MTEKRELRSDDPSLDAHRVIGKAMREEEVDFREYVAILRRRWLAMLMVAAIVFGAAAFNAKRQRKVYEASTKLVVVTKSNSMASGAGSSAIMGELADLRQARDVETQSEIIGSPDLIEKAFRKLTPDERAAGFDGDLLPAWAYSVSSKPETDVITITGRAYEPAQAAQLANAIAEAYLEQDLMQNSMATRQAREYVQRERDRTNTDLELATARLASYKRRSGLVAAPEQASGLAKVRIDLRNGYDAAQGESNAARRRLAVIQHQIAVTAPEIDLSTTTAQNPEFGLVQAQIVGLEGQLTQQSQEFTPTSIEITQLKRQLSEQQDRLRELSRTVVASKQTQQNPVRTKLLEDYADAKAAGVVAAARAQALGTQLGRLEKDIQGYPEQERQLSDLQQRVDSLRRTYNMLSDRYYALLIDERSSLPSGLIAAKARRSDAPSSPKTTLNLAFGLILALACAASVGILLEKLDTRTHTLAEVEKAYGVPSLAAIPEARAAKRGQAHLRIGGVVPNKAFTESYRLLRNNIGFLSPHEPIRSVGVTSATSGEGKSTVAVNLAIVMGMAGRRVLLVDADLRDPTLHEWMGVGNDVGFSSVSGGRTSLVEAIHPTSFEGVSCLTSGPPLPDPTEFPNPEPCRELVRQAMRLYDMVIVNAPPCTGLSDTQIVSTMVDGMIVVAALGKTSKPSMTATIRMLRQANANVLGLVVNRAEANAAGYGASAPTGYGPVVQDASRSNGKLKKPDPKAEKEEVEI